MVNKTTIIGISILVILLIVGIFFFNPNLLLLLQSTLGDTEAQLKQQFITFWADKTDGDANSLSCTIIRCTSSTDCSSPLRQHEEKILQIKLDGFGCSIFKDGSQARLYYEDDKFVITGQSFFCFT